MDKVKQTWHAFTHAAVVVEIWHALQLASAPVFATMAFVTALAENLPLSFVIAISMVVFGAAVCTINQLGILFGRPLSVRSEEDYSYGISYVGAVIALDKANRDATLQIGLKITNTSRAAIRYKVERFEVVVGSRTIGQKTYLSDGGLLPLMSARTYNYPAFKYDDIAEYLENRTTGTIEVHITYGHPDHAPVRRLKLKLDISLRLDSDFALADTIREEIDEPIY